MQVNAKLHAEYESYIEDANPVITYQEWLEDKVISSRFGWLFAGFMSFLCAAIMVLDTIQ